MSISIVIDDDHPHFRTLQRYLELPACDRGCCVMTEQHADGTWSLRIAKTSPLPSPLHSKRYSVQIRVAKR